MQPLDSHKHLITALSDIEQKCHQIYQLFKNNIQNSLNCGDFLQVQAAVVQHFKEAINYINRCISSISKQHPQSNFPKLEFHGMIDTINPDSLSADIRQTIDQVEFQLRDLSTAIDQWSFIIRDCPYVETRPNVLLLAKAMSEIFEIQHVYIYPYHADLIPSFLQKSDFNQLKSPNKH